MKKTISLLLALALALTLAACGAPSGGSAGGASGSETPADVLKGLDLDSAEYQGVCGVDARWYFLQNMLVITGTGAVTEYDREAPWYDEAICAQITWLVVDEGITELPENAFSELS